jgi:hypothetical protein
MLFPGIVRFFLCSIPAFIGSVSITPLSTVAECAVVKSAESGNIFLSLKYSMGECRLNEKSAVTFLYSFSTLLAKNIFVDKRVKMISGIAVGTCLAAVKDSIYMGGNLSTKTRVLLSTKDVISLLFSLPDMCYKQRVLMVLVYSIPCTLLESISLDMHIYGGLYGRQERVTKSFISNLPIRFFRSTICGATGFHINSILMNTLFPI